LIHFDLPGLQGGPSSDNVATWRKGGEEIMATHLAAIKWSAKESGEDFLKGRFSRAHTVSFDGGTEVPASASPHVVGKWAVEAAVDPEEMLVAALSSCHMLSFLHLARLAGFIVRSYEDHAQGTTAEIAAGRVAVTEVKLRPDIDWASAAPSKEELGRLHHEAHEICFIANSVKTHVTVV
jgi:organic hydroperoxide reductase OsmC/OhrA